MNTFWEQHSGSLYLKNYNAERIKILECALEDLERIKREGEPKLPPITEDEPIIY